MGCRKSAVSWSSCVPEALTGAHIDETESGENEHSLRKVCAFRGLCDVRGSVGRVSGFRYSSAGMSTFRELPLSSIKTASM